MIQLDSPIITGLKPLRAFIQDHEEEIIQEFAVFARTLMPPGPEMSEAELRDHAKELLTAVVLDMGLVQDAGEQSRKSRGLGVKRTMAASGLLHADARIDHGFSLLAVLAEFRALRASVLRFYELSGATDLAEVRRFNESVDEALTESMERFAAKTDSFRDQFVGVVGHDLRGPLGAITTGVALLAAPEDNSQRRARVVSSILNSAQRMQRLIDDLLDWTRAKFGGRIPLSPAETDLRQVCEEMMLETAAAYPTADLTFEASGNLVGQWDRDRLAQIVSNLVGNAVKYGEGTPIALFADDEGEDVVLRVHNGGAPISEDVLPFVFEPLVRGHIKDRHAADGIGLGLFIARALVAAHGGDLSVTSAPDLGTTLTMRLPKGGSAPGS